jgi:acetyltransferase-like isoleucine patch superfamily enzyme
MSHVSDFSGVNSRAVVATGSAFGDGVVIHPFAIVGFQPMRGPTFARPVEKQPPAKLGEGVAVGPFALVYAGSEIGDHTMICPYVSIREGVRIGKRCVIGIGVSIGYDAVIGDDVQIMDHAHISGGTVIGSRCFVAQHTCTANDDRPGGYVWKGITPITIGDDCVIGAASVIRPGVKIGAGATVAMGAIVTRDVPAGALIKGEPSRVVSVPSRDLGQAVLGFVSEDELLAGMPRQVYPNGVESVG